ncbi:hypothetical protein M6B38_128685 [Iris pallida]|uniref:Uncharacterized protein n=1 Tax=Iris pallida TaxID=29817 RepID=A0AAX6FYH5_IRIPA|nr:hypothetical protein M6B38_393595 [Iris pallida]KAJ6823636.1 hypothetical protein M6B38_128685 [Iris pallida]
MVEVLVVDRRIPSKRAAGVREAAVVVDLLCRRRRTDRGSAPRRAAHRRPTEPPWPRVETRSMEKWGKGRVDGERGRAPPLREE